MSDFLGVNPFYDCVQRQLQIIFFHVHVHVHVHVGVGVYICRYRCRCRCMYIVEYPKSHIPVHTVLG